MYQPTTKDLKEPLYLGHLPSCQRVYDEIQQYAGLEMNAEESERLATILIDLHRQGIDDPDELKSMARVARGLI